MKKIKDYIEEGYTVDFVGGEHPKKQFSFVSERKKKILFFHPDLFDKKDGDVLLDFEKVISENRPEYLEEYFYMVKKFEQAFVATFDRINRPRNTDLS